MPAFASASSAVCVERPGCSTPNARVPSVRAEIRCRRLPCLGLRFDAGQGALERWRPSQIAARQTARRKLNSSGGGSAAPRGQDGGAQAFVVRVGGWLQRPASSGSGGESRSKVSDYLS